jgi:hypothetical protein
MVILEIEPEAVEPSLIKWIEEGLEWCAEDKRKQV